MSNLDSVAETARRLKVERAAQFGDAPDDSGLADIITTVLVVRDGEQVAMLIGDGPSGARVCAYWGAALFAAEEVYLVADAFMREQEDTTDPGQGALSRDWEAGQRDRMHESLVISRYPAEGKPTLHAFPYERKGKTVRWLQPHKSQDIEGAVHEHALQGYADGITSPMWAQLKEQANVWEMDEAEARWHTDRAVARHISVAEGILRVELLNPRSSWVKGQEETAPQ
jgi:hypothetical protein